MDTTAVILAVASPPGRSARGVVRASGPATFDLLRPHLKLEAPWARGLHHGRLTLLGPPLPCLALVFPGPESYTGEDAIELHLPGNPLLLERIVDTLIDVARDTDLETRRAEPGEFTARAFWHGRLSLTEAEGVAATIAARSDAALRAAHRLTGGKLDTLARGLADDLATTLALVEAGIDFTDQEDVVPVSPADLHRTLTRLRDEVRGHVEHAVGMEQLDAIPWVVLAGPPNAGKSTLFNALLGRRRAVVSSAAGTTRDVLAEPLTLETDHGPAEVMLADVAGHDPAVSGLAGEMQTRAREATRRADLVLECRPVDTPAHGGDASAGGDVVMVRTKIDLAEPTPDTSRADIGVSALSGEGLDELCAAIATRLGERAVSLAADTAALHPRHEAALRLAGACLDEVLRRLTPHRVDRVLPDPELLAVGIRNALDAIEALAGRMTPDDVLGRVFSTFCVGK